MTSVSSAHDRRYPSKRAVRLSVLSEDSDLGRIGVVAVLALLGLALVAGCARSPAPVASAQGIRMYAAADRKPAPPLRGELLDGTGTFDLADHVGDVVVVNFWAQWCAPCVVEADDLEQTYQATKDDKVRFLGVNTRDQRDNARRFVVGRATYPSVFDPKGKVALGFAVPPTTMPATVIIDRQGRIAAIALGAVIRADLEPVVTQLAGESA